MTLSERYDRWWDALDDAVNFRDERFDVAKVMAVADAEQAELRAEVAELRERLEQRTQALHRTALDKDAAEAKVARVQALHVKVFTSVSDEVYGNNPTCSCDQRWPCDTRAALDGAP
jgi:hypothetical protein